MKVIDDITEFIFVKDELEEVDILFIPGGSYTELGEMMKCGAQFKTALMAMQNNKR